MPERHGVLDAPSSYLLPALAGALKVSESEAFYRTRHPERLVFYQLFEQHFDEYLYAYEERFEPSAGPLRSVVPKAVEAFLSCGRPEGGFARLKCPDCKVERLLAFSCGTRCFCPSCQAKRAALFAEKLVDDLLAPVPHRHYTFTVPVALRGLFRRDRCLLGLLARSAYDAVSLCLKELFEGEDVRAGCVLSLHTAGSYAANWQPHAHALISEGVFTAQGEFLPLPSLDTGAIEEVFRALILGRLHQAERLSESFMQRLASWSPSGFSVHAEQRVEAHETARLERLARYLARAPVRIDSVSKLDDNTVHVSTPPHPATGRKECILDVLEWIHAVTAHIPDRRQHTTLRFGAYSNRNHTAPRRRPRAEPSGASHTQEPEQPFLKARRASWARLIKRVFEVDPLLCACGGSLYFVSFITEPETIDRILRHLRTHPPSLVAPSAPLEARAPPC